MYGSVGTYGDKTVDYTHVSASLVLLNTVHGFLVKMNI